MRRLLCVFFVLGGGCRDWRAHADPARVASEPEQVSITGEPMLELELKRHHVRLAPRATYRITGYAAETSRTLLDEWDFIMPMDLALIWGPVADPAVLRHLRFHLSERYVSYWYDAETPSAAVGKLATHIANNHLIPATEEVATALEHVRIGDLVTIQGRLVDVEIHDSQGKLLFRSRTSLTRDDMGSGACEIVWVESVEMERPE